MNDAFVIRYHIVAMSFLYVVSKQGSIEQCIWRTRMVCTRIGLGFVILLTTKTPQFTCLDSNSFLCILMMMTFHARISC